MTTNTAPRENTFDQTHALFMELVLNGPSLGMSSTAHATIGTAATEYSDFGQLTPRTPIDATAATLEAGYDQLTDRLTRELAATDDLATHLRLERTLALVNEAQAR